VAALRSSLTSADNPISDAEFLFKRLAPPEATKMAQIHYYRFLLKIKEFAQRLIRIARAMSRTVPAKIAGSQSRQDDFPSVSDDYTRRVMALHRKLRIPADYAGRGLPFHREALELVPVPCGRDGK
jgi:hypothetical protein